MQTKLGSVATEYLNKDFNVDIQIEKVDLAYIGDIKLKQVFIRDHHADTLIYVDDLSTSIFSYRNILRNKMDFGELNLSSFKLFVKTYKGEMDDALTVFADKFDEGKQSNEPSGFVLQAESLELENGYVEIADYNRIDEKPLYFKDISGNVTDFQIEGPNVSANIESISFLENHNLKIENFSCLFDYTKQQMTFEKVNIQTETSQLEADLVFTNENNSFANFKNKVTIDASIKLAAITTTDLNHFYNEFGNSESFHFRGLVTGTLNDLWIKNLKLVSSRNAFIEGDYNFYYLFDREKEFLLNANISKLISNYEHLTNLLPNVLGGSLPKSLKQFGRFSVSGFTSITEQKINTDIKVDSELGTVITDIALDKIGLLDEMIYTGEVEIINFELGRVMKDSLVGQLSMKAEVDGQGFSIETLNTAVNGKVTKHQYKNYTYDNIIVNGIFKNKHFNGEMEVNDENIKLNFNGLADFSSDVYNFDFEALVDYCDLNTINLFKRDSISNIAGEISIKVEGNSVDDLVGTASFEDFSYTNQNERYFFEGFNITSSITDSIKTITIDSPEIIDGNIVGRFKFEELDLLAQNSIGSIYSNYEPFEVAPNQSLDFRFRIHNKIIEVFFPEVHVSPTTTIRGSIDSNNGLFSLNLKSPEIDAYKHIIDNVNLQINNKNPLFNTQLVVNEIRSDYYNLSDLLLVNITLNDTLFFRTEFKGGIDKTEDFNLSFYHTFNDKKESVFGIQKSDLNFKNNKWNINPSNDANNKVVYSNKTKIYDLEPFIISSEGQEIQFYGSINDTLSKTLHFNFENVELAKITPNIDSLSLNGLINGSLDYNEIYNQLKPSANLSISNFEINKSEQGNLFVNVTGKNSLKNYDVDIELNREGITSFSALGELDFTSDKPALDLSLNFQAFKLDAFSPLGEDVFTNIKGFAYGDVNLTGLIENPDMDGTLFLDRAALYFPYLNVTYGFEGTSVIELAKQEFNFFDVSLVDSEYNTKGDLKGTLSHSYFDNWELDLLINTQNLLVLDTEEKENSVYYGTGFLEGEATIKGRTDKLVIDVNGRTKKNTHFVIPISDVKTVESSQLIRFINEDSEEEIEEVRRAFISEKLKGLSLNFNMEVTKDAIVEMVLDKSTGSYLKGSGTGNLIIELDTKDKFDMYGDFLVDNGIYNFKYGGFINKPFIVKKGGNISWNGDPFTADIDIEAVYRVSANPRSLLENISANRKIPIDLITRFSGELFNSERAFDIEIPNASSTVASELEFKLNNNDENVKTRHFVSLLATGAFYNDSDFSINTSGLVYGTATDLLSNAFDNIFNQGNSKFKLKPVYTFGEKNKVDNLNIDDQLSLALDYQLNDRVIINGKVGMPIGSKEQSSVIGEVNVEFLMNEEGTLKSSIFNRQNEIQYTEEEEGYTQGVGLSYQIDFDNSKELFEKLGLKRRSKSIDSTSIKKVKDSLLIKKELINFASKKNNNK